MYDIMSLYSLTQNNLQLSLKVREESCRFRTIIDLNLSGKLYIPTLDSDFVRKKDISINLYSEHYTYEETHYIYIIDLVGNGSIETRGKGMGTLLFNTLLQFLKQNYPPNSQVYGNIISDDIHNRVYIENFWKNFGFKVVPINNRNSERKIISNLDELRFNKSPKIVNSNWSTFIPIELLTKPSEK